MELNTRGRYAVMAMADIAKFGASRAVALPEISERQHLPVAYLEQIFARLREAGLVLSVRGRGGGYRLGRLATEIPIADIMAAVEEGTRMTRCFEDESLGCVGSRRCLTHELWRALGSEIEGFLRRVTLHDVVDGTFAVSPQPSDTATGPEAVA